jgi:hypothetical protein
VEALLQDLRLSCRLLAKNPGFTAVAVLCMALGSGANTTVYSIVEAALLRPFPFADPGRIVALHRSRTQEPSADTFSYLDLLDLQRQSVTLSPIAGYASQSLTFAGNGGEPERVAGQRVSVELLPLLGVRPALGRGFLPQEDRPGAPAVILLGNELWQRRFHGDPAVLGRTVMVNDVAHTVVGVMPPRFGFPALAEAWVPLAPIDHALARGDRRLDVLARLRPARRPWRRSSGRRCMRPIPPCRSSGWPPWTRCGAPATGSNGCSARCSGSSAPSRSPSPRSASTACCPTTSASGCPRSACGWPWAPGTATCWPW